MNSAKNDMLSDLKNYSVLEQIFLNKNSVVQKAVSKQTHQPVILKRSRSDTPRQQEVAILNNEYTILKHLDDEHVIKALELFQEDKIWYLALEDFQGDSLKTFLGEQTFDIKNFLEIAIQITKGLDYLHSKKIVHNDIKPANILINPQKRIKLIDFSIASMEELNTQNIGSEFFLKGSLEYISPEQTGRVNRAVDHRTDFYSLGITFFEMLTGKLPFEETDTLELIYAHLARVPPSLEKFDLDIPQMICLIIYKLMAKNPEDRYQTTRGLLKDLECCLTQLNETQTITPFTLGKFDTQSQLQLSAKLYGRTHEIEYLKTLVKDISEQKSSILLISGYSGIGKSSLTKELQPEFLKNHIQFIDGKFEQLEKNIPYFGFIQAIKKYVHNLLTEPQTIIEETKARLLESLSNQGQIIVDIVPEIEWIIGKQPEVVLGSSIDSQNRFKAVIRQFFQAIATPKRPLILFLDDLQWADAASLAIIDEILPGLQNFALIGAYRSNELQKHKLCAATLQNLKKTSSNFHEIELKNLEYHDVVQFLQDTFNQKNVESLAKQMMLKTEGNPFFLKQLLLHLYKSKLLKFDFDKSSWIWSDVDIENQKITDNVIDLMVKRVDTLPLQTRSLLSAAATLGNNFSLDVLSQILEKPKEEMIEPLSEAVKIGLLSLAMEDQRNLQLLKDHFEVKSPINYSFVHDKIQQGSYEYLNDSLRESLHLQIGRLGKALPIDELVHHYNKAIRLLENPKERLEVANLNLILAKKSKESNAYDAALQYLNKAEELVSKDFTFEKNFDYLFKLYRDKAEALFQTIQLPASEKLFSELIAKTKNRNLKASLYALKAKLYSHQDRHEDSIEAGIEGLALYGMRFPKTIKIWHIAKEILKVKFLGMFKNFDNLKPMRNKRALMISELLNSIITPAFQTDQNLFALIAAYGSKLFIKHGYTHSLFGVLVTTSLFVAIGDYKTAKFYYDLTRKLKDKIGKVSDWGIVLTVSGFLYDNCFFPFSKARDSLEKGSILCYETGSHFYALFGKFMRSTLDFRLGVPLPKMIKETLEINKELKETQRMGGGSLETNLICVEIYDYLAGKPALDEQLIHHSITLLEGAKSKSWVKPALRTVAFCHYIMENYELALKYAKNSLDSVPPNMGIICQDHHLLFCYLSFARDSNHTSEMAVIEKTMATFAKQNPENYLGFYELILGEKHRFNGDFKKAIDHFDNALDDFKNHQWPQYSGVTCELLSAAYQGLKRLDLSKYYIQEAYYYYNIWGAQGKLNLLKKRYPTIFEEGQLSSHTLNTTSSHFQSSSQMIDFLSILKTTRAISEEIDVSKLIEMIMVSILEATGGQRCVLLTENRDQLIVQGECFIAEKGTTSIHHNTQLENFANLPHNMIKYVHQTKEPLIANIEHPFFNKDKYFNQKNIQAILCLPIRERGTSLGVLYIEHDTNKNAFHVNLLETVRILTSQATISLENAQLYSAYKRFVPYEFLSRLDAEKITDIKLGDMVNTTMTVLFADIRGFTALSETLAPQDVFLLINQFLGSCAPNVRKNGGFIDKYIGDAIMGLFPNSNQALKAALDIFQSINTLNESRLLKGKPEIHIGIGINTGPLSLGIIGEEMRLEGSVLGDTVNAASRLESLNPIYGTHILISGETYKTIKNKELYKLTYVDSVKVKGKSIPIEIWSLALDSQPQVNLPQSSGS